VAFIPEDAKWWVADIVEEIRVQGDHRNVVHTNQTLIRADSPAEAYSKAIALGKQGNTNYKNPEGKMVTIRFRGLRNLDVIHDKLQDGAEIGFHRDVAVGEKRIKSWVRPKNKLNVFAPLRPHGGPDYASAEVMEGLYKRWPHLRGARGSGCKKTSKLTK
jgi:hypothetical protein